MTSPDPARRAGTLVGPLLVLSYCVANSVKSVVEGRLVQDISPEFYAFNAFFVIQVLYLALCRDHRALLAAVRRCLPDVLAYNVTTTLSWVAVLYALRVFEPAVTNSLIVGMVPVLTILIGGRLRPQARPSRTEVLSSLGVLASMGYLAAMTLTGSSGTGSVSAGGFVLGVVASVVTAAAVAGNTFYTKRLGEAGMKPGQMMACRFPLLLVSTLVLFLVRGSAAPYSAVNVTLFLVLGLGVAGTLLLLQVGITRTEPMTVSLLFGSNLILTFAIQFFDPRIDQSVHTLIGVLLLTGFILWGSLSGVRQAAGADREPPRAPAPATDTSPHRS
ncbi:EamA/RhaT family transporter [Streptomyces broussonetiae]|uniref:EamA/RhaT family transporter n=1 Tax=Streptomyces broussonetiae TaxID=2686304 RepID=A0A6I6N1F5_9ACTN|nr:EamA/RhaT family transporter [Streptomyces broussonetiae]QHA06978.1 EamA/RhaT family transporter [Streptomyces broussonetiae]